MKKISGIALVMALLLLTIMNGARAFAQTALTCDSVETVAAGDTLSKFAAKAYGDPKAYFPIFSATNSQAIADKTFHFIDNPNEIEIGWKICVPAAETAPVGLSTQELKNATYKSDYGTDGAVKLTDGKFSAPAAPDTPLMNTVFLGNEIAYGDVNGVPSAAVILVESGGGSGVFYVLHLVQNQNGSVTDIASAQLGDRINPTSLYFQNGKIVLGMTTQGPDEPMCCGTQRVLNTYTLNGAKLEQASTQVVGNVEQTPTTQPTTAPAQTLAGTTWKWTGSLFNDGKQTTPDDPNRYLLSFMADGSVSIQADCNQVGGTYTTDGNQLTITLGPSTLVACPPDSLDQEYLRQLGIVSSYFWKDGNLILEFKFDSGSMTFAPGAPASLSGTRWNVISYNNGKQAVVGLFEGSEISLNFADNRVSGNAGCNNYTGGYEASGGALKVGGLATTFKLCHKPDGVMEQEQKYLTALQSAATYEIRGDMLTIRDGGGAMQVLAKANLPAGLGGTQWQVTGYNNGKQALVSLILDTAITLNFGKDNRVSGGAGCNNYTGGYESGDGTLKVGALAATQKFCVAPEGIMEQEQQYLAALQNSATYDITGDTLTLRDSSGAMQVTAKKFVAPPLAGTEWTVTGYNNGKQAVTSPILDTALSLRFGTDNRVSGNAGCNTFNGGFETNGDALKIGPLASTRKECGSPEGVMAQEQQYLAALQNAATFDITSNILTIRDASGATQVVATVYTPPALAGSSWSVVNYNNGKQAVVGLVADTKITLDFGTDGHVSGNGGCNTYGGSYESNDSTLKVSQVVSTLMFCESPKGVMDQEQQYLAALQNAATYEISGSTLTIRDASGAMQVTATVRAPVTLAGEWNVHGVNNGKEAVVGVIQGSSITMNFGADGTVSGSGGCNSYSGTYTSTADTIKFGPIAATEKACLQPTGVMEQEQQFFTALTKSTTYEITNDTLFLHDANGAQQVTATR